MGKSRVSGPGRMGSASAVKKSLKKGGNSKVKIIPKEDSLTVRFLQEPEDFHGYYEHYVDGEYRPCVTDECPGCNSDDPDEQRRMFRYLANGYVVDDQKVWAIKMPKTLVEGLMVFYDKYKTLLDRDYDLSRTGSGQNDTKYFAAPDAPSKMKLSRFESKMLDLDDVVDSMVDDDDDEDDDKPSKSKKSKKSKSGKSKKERDPWDDDEDDEDEPVKKKSKSKSASKGKTVAKKSVAKKKVAPKKKTTVKRTVRRK